jgi:hypothetical protein
MEDMICLVLSFLDLMSTLQRPHLDTAVYEEEPPYPRLSSAIPGYHDEEYIHPFRRRERAKKRCADECRWHR